MIEEIPVERCDEYFSLQMEYLVNDGILSDPEDIDYFAGEEYRSVIVSHMKRRPDTHHLVYYVENGVRCGVASFNTYQSEDGKCFILDYWILPAYRNNGAGHRFFDELVRYTENDGARYYELNSEKPDSIRFWQSLGFLGIGKDEYGVPLFRRDPVKETALET